MGADVVIAIATVVLAAARPCPRTFAERTRRGYRDELSDLIGFLTSKSVVARPDQARREHLEGFLTKLDRRRFKGGTRPRKAASIRSSFSCVQDAVDVVVAPAHKLIPSERKQLQPRGLTESVKKRTKLGVVREALGHSSLKTTSIGAELAREVMDKERQGARGPAPLAAFSTSCRTPGNGS